MSQRTWIEFHFVQSYPVSNLNRDEAGNPKAFQFGAVTRAAVSSQCLKRAQREQPAFHDGLDVPLGWRTRLTAELLLEEFRTRQIAPEAYAAAARALVTAYYGVMEQDEKNGWRTLTVVFTVPAELRLMADLVIEHRETLEAWATTMGGDTGAAEEDAAEDTAEVGAEEAGKAKPKKGKLSAKALDKREVARIIGPLVKQFKAHVSAPDLALFGRMMAQTPEVAVDAALQVAPAFSVHGAALETDFWTALDEVAPPGSGAGGMGQSGQVAAIYYRYAAIDWRQLVLNLHGDQALARKTVCAYAHAALLASPAGKVHGYAHATLPEVALAVVRPGYAPVNLCNAYVNPLRLRPGESLLDKAVVALFQRYTQEYALLGIADAHTPLVLAVDAARLPQGAPAPTPTLPAWLTALEAALPQRQEA